MKMLVVASPTLSPLSTDGPIPTDGQPEHRHLGPKADCRDHHGDVRTRIPHDHTAAWVFDGPYPFTVAVWQEVAMPDVNEDEGDCIGDCGRRTNGWFAAGGWGPGWYCGWCEAVPAAVLLVGAVVATVEVTGKGHDADECLHRTGETFVRGGVELPASDSCHPDALPDCWHTPTGQVRRLDVPVPMERPPVDCSGPASPHTFHREWSKDCPECGPDGPAPWWWADLDLEAAP